MKGCLYWVRSGQIEERGDLSSAHAQVADFSSGKQEWAKRLNMSVDTVYLPFRLQRDRHDFRMEDVRFVKFFIIIRLFRYFSSSLEPIIQL